MPWLPVPAAFRYALRLKKVRNMSFNSSSSSQQPASTGTSGHLTVARDLNVQVQDNVEQSASELLVINAVLKQEILAELDKLPANQQVMLKLTIPDVDNFFAELIKHPRVLKVVALSGGYSRDEANKRLAKQNGMIASFSRALSEGLSAQQSEAEFDKALDASIQSIYDASKT